MDRAVVGFLRERSARPSQGGRRYRGHVADRLRGHDDADRRRRSEIDHRVETFGGGSVNLVDVRGASQAGGLRSIGSTQSLVLRPESDLRLPLRCEPARPASPAAVRSGCRPCRPTDAPGQSASVFNFRRGRPEGNRCRHSTGQGRSARPGSVTSRHSSACLTRPTANPPAGTSGG